MKNKLIRILTLGVILAIWLGRSKGDNSGILSFLDYADWQIESYGYTYKDSLTIANISNSYIDVESPVIKSGTKDITAYLFIATTEQAWRNPVAYRCFDDVTINWNKFSVWLSTSSLNRSDIYYIYATPLDSITWVWAYNWSCSASDAKDFLEIAYSAWNDSSANGYDPCFIIEDKFYWEWRDCENHKNPWSSTIYSVTWVSDVYDWTNIKLTWRSYANTKLDIYLRDEANSTFNSLWTVNSEQQYFTFKAVYEWDHIIKIRPQDGSQEINHTVHHQTSSSPQVQPSTPTNPVKPPVVWPKENIMYIILWTLILYAVYRIARRKA